MNLEAFKEKTTYLNDYKNYSDLNQTHKSTVTGREVKHVKLPPKKVFEDHETFSKWKEGVHIPFDLLLEPKPILQMDPRKPFEKLAPLPEDDKNAAIKTRPRIYMTPACSIDDIPDPDMRDLLCQFMYTTEWRKAEIEGASGFKIRPPKISEIHRSDKVTLQTDLYKPLEERFIKRSKNWDDRQSRDLSDPTREFWLRKDPPVLCGACVNPLEGLVPQDTKAEIAGAIADDRLRLPHDLSSPSYSGYKPLLPKGVSIARTDLPVCHPLLSTSQAVTSRYAQKPKS
ncbi:hypothetical protein GWI33_013094 [Rhynchophorus ferrugineus]|uniref:Uncharacterized protein n=1 Tax=Rhynchophorus ferrugineus TaxID=354439 RepID=A0A834I8W8_RHYFE|nr:hypothetical protein GWI33_013094 [Rhynchophorus ferrugineus]